ncbi:MAG: MFS transporter, partial [Candidatus Zixiibacteriota bacterium]
MQPFKFSRLSTLVKSYDSRMWILFFGWMISAMGFAMVIPYLSIYFHNRMNIPMSQVGLLFGVGAIAQSLFGLWGGDLSDKIGRVKIMGSAQLIRSVIFLLMGLLAWKGGS